jgi:hypothetical protein
MGHVACSRVSPVCMCGFDGYAYLEVWGGEEEAVRPLTHRGGGGEERVGLCDG